MKIVGGALCISRRGREFHLCYILKMPYIRQLDQHNAVSWSVLKTSDERHQFKVSVMNEYISLAS